MLKRLQASDTTANLHLQCSDTFETRPSWWLDKKLEKVAANVEGVRNDHRPAIESKWLSNRNLYYVYRTRSHRNTLWGLPFASEEEKGRMDKVLELWNNYCIGKANTIYERYKFHIRAQEPEAWRLCLLALLSCLHAYAFSLRTLADTCSFGALENEMIRDRLVYGISDSGLRKNLPQESELKL